MKKLMCGLFALFCSVAYGASVTAPTTILGFTIGDTFNLSECHWKGDGALATYDYDFDQPATPCWKHSILKAHPGDPLDAKGTFKIGVVPAHGKTPDGVRSDSLQLIVVSGKIEGIFVPTNGLDGQDSFLALLIKKCGKPESNQQTEVENRFGAKFTKYTVAWKKPDALITFDSMVSSTDWGLIEVASPLGRKFLEDEQVKRENSSSF
jgi:hypothetical protein